MNVEDYKELATKKFDDPEKNTTNCRNEDRFVQIKHLLSVVSDPNSDVADIDWKQVSQLAAEILGNESKDLLVASYLTIALLKVHNMPGLKIGIDILHEMVDAYWETLYPPLRRINGRWTAFNWLIEQLTDYLEKFEGLRPKTEIDPLLATLTDFDKKLSNLSEDAPNFLFIIKQIERIIEPEKIVEVPVAPSNQADSEEKSVANANIVSELVNQEINSVDDALDHLKNIWNAIQETADYLKESQSELSLAYRLTRVALWQSIINLPEYDENYKTKVPAPEKEQLKQLQVLKEANNYQGIITICEEWVSENPFWLDLHYEIFQAMMLLPAYVNVARVVKVEVLALYHRLPLINKLTFSDGTPMMNSEMFEWLQQDLSSDDATTGSGNQGDQKQVHLNSQEKGLLKSLKKVGASPKNKRLEELAKLQHYLFSDVAENLKIDLLIAIIDSLLVTQNKSMLESFSKHLEEKLDYFRLEEWDKTQAGDILIRLIDAKKILKVDYANYYQRLSLLNIQTALDILK